MDAQVQQTLPQEDGIRLCFRFIPQDILGEPGARPITVADAFMQQNFERKFDWEKDHIYTPAGIDEVDGRKRKLFMFLDVNKHANPTFQTLRCYQVAEGSPMYGVPSLVCMLANILNRTFEETRFNGVRNFSNIFPWGGRDTRQLERNTVHPVSPEVQGMDQQVID